MAAVSERGMSLVEVTIIMVVVAILTAVAAPTAKRTIDAAKLTRTASDESAIETAIINFLSNTGNNSFSIDGSNPAVGGAAVVETLVSDGDTPRECNPTQGCITAPLWINAVDNTGGLTDFLERHLVTNNPRGSSANDYPVGAAAWRGAYISAPIDPDPWGNRYAVNVKWLGTNSNCGSRTNDVFVLSAGPDEIIDTPYRIDTPNCNAGTAGTGGSVPKNDDIIQIVRRDVGVGVP